MSLPQSPDAERALLSSLMQNSSILDEAADNVSSKLFHNPSNQRIFNAIVDLWTAGTSSDLITITDHMLNAGTLELVGGPSYVTECFTFMPTALNWREYLKILKGNHIQRLSISVAEKIIATANDPSQSEDLSEVVQKALVAVAADSETSSRIESVREVACKRLDDYEQMVKNRGKLIGITTGIKPLDEITGGFRKGQLVVIGAPTKGGKTSLALNMGMRTADMGGNPVGIISLEMTAGELMDRLISSHSGADISLLSKEGEVNNNLMKRISLGVAQISKLPIWIRDESSLNCLQLRAAVRRMVSVHNIKMIIVDYIQLLEPTNSKDSRERQVAEVSRTLKTLAKEMNIVIVALTQLNAEGASRESRAIEHDCDLFLTISQDQEQQNNWFLNIKLARSCGRASIPLSFRSEYLRFDER